MPESMQWPGLDKPAPAAAAPQATQWPGLDKPAQATAQAWPGLDKPKEPAFTERALPWETPKPGQPQAQWHELPGALAEFGKNVWEGIKGAASLPGETYTEGLKGNLPGGLGGTGGPENFEERASNLAGLVTLGGGGPSGTKSVGAGLIPKVASAATQAAQPAAKLVQKILSPQTVSPTNFVSSTSHMSQDAAASIRAAGGQAARDTATTAAQMEPHHRLINSMPEPDRLAFIEYVEGNPSLTGQMPAQARPLANALKDAAQLREAKLRALPSTAQMGFKDDYLAHFWQDPQAAQKIEAAGGGASKQGSGASLKKRTVPTYQEGIAAGLKPLTTDPIEMTMRYVSSMDRFIASTEVLDAAKANGTVIYVRPKAMGASGHPDSIKVPEGYALLKGRGAVDKTGAQAYAPEDFARVYNNYISRGFAEWGPEFGNAADAVQHASNSISALELGLSGFHALNIATSAVASEVGRSVSNIVGGKPLRGMEAAGHALVSPASLAYKGHKVQQVYLGKSLGTPDMRKVVDVLTKSGGRLVGKHASDYEFSPMGSFWTAWKRGALKAEMSQPGAKTPWRLVGRAMETISDPLFKDYIPKVKAAAQYDLLRDWIEANPTATHEQTMAMGRKIVDAMDDRFGEMIQDNLFVNKAFKQIAQIAMLSYSWTLGLGRQVAGAVKDPRKLSISHKDYNPSVAGIIGAAVAVPMINAIYQKLKSGKDPESIDDLMAPRTGGEGFGASVPSAARGFHRSAQARVPERAILPSHERDIFGWYYEPGQEFKNKFSFFPKMAMEWAMPGPTDVDLSDYLKIVGQSLVPISGQQLMRGHMEGSALGPGASLAGVRPAPSYLQDPEGYVKQKENLHTIAGRRKAAIERKQESKYGGPNE